MNKEIIKNAKENKIYFHINHQDILTKFNTDKFNMEPMEYVESEKKIEAKMMHTNSIQNSSFLHSQNFISNQAEQKLKDMCNSIQSQLMEIQSETLNRIKNYNYKKNMISIKNNINKAQWKEELLKSCMPSASKKLKIR